MSERMKTAEKTPDQLHESQNRAAEKVKSSIVNLLNALGVSSTIEHRGQIWEKFFSRIQQENSEITAQDQGYSRSGKKNERQNLALLKFIKGRIERQEILDPRTLEFKSVNRAKLERFAQEMKVRFGLEAAKQEVEKSRKVYENAKEVLQGVALMIEQYERQNRNRPYETNVTGAKMPSSQEFVKKGTTMVRDNLTGKELVVDKDPQKAQRVKDSFGREKILTGAPALCTTAVIELLSQAGIAVPKENRSVYRFQNYVKNHKSYTVIPQNLKFPGYGKLIKFPVPAQVGDVITTKKIVNGFGQNHISIVTEVKDGFPTKVLDSSAVNVGIGQRPFLSATPADLITDAKGHPRSKALFGPEVIVTSIIRPHYQEKGVRFVQTKNAPQSSIN
jgi:hypothetical protein